MKKYILLLFLAVCAQLSADTLNKETLFKGTAMLNGKAIPMWFNVTGNATAEIGNGKNSAISQYAEGKLVVRLAFAANSLRLHSKRELKR